jgi:hypothetical protein
MENSQPPKVGTIQQGAQNEIAGEPTPAVQPASNSESLPKGDPMADHETLEEGFYKSYAEYSKTLRTWFVAYGIGGPVVLLSNNRAWGWLVASGVVFRMGLLFLLGGVLQVISALLNKHAMWYLYVGEYKTATKNESSWKLADKYSDQGWVDVLIDVITLVLFAWATWLAFSTIMSAPPQIFITDKS